MKRIVILSLFVLAVALLPTGGVSAQSKLSPATQVAADCDPNGGADRYAGRGNNPRSHYYRHADYYNLCSNGTADFIGDDTLILADPCDITDHWQDGYTTAPLGRFFYLRKDRAIAPKPYQLQPFIVLERL